MNKITEEAKLLFREAVSDVKPFCHNRSIVRPNPHKQLRKKLHLRRRGFIDPWFEESEVKQTVTALAKPETRLVFQRIPLPSKQLNALNKGNFSTRCKIDLHGLTEQQAEEIMRQALQRCNLRTDRYMIVVHGKGLSNASEHPVLKNWLNWWLRQQIRVTAFNTAQPCDGGAGAVYILLASTYLNNTPNYLK